MSSQATYEWLQFARPGESASWKDPGGYLAKPLHRRGGRALRFSDIVWLSEAVQCRYALVHRTLNGPAGKLSFGWTHNMVDADMKPSGHLLFGTRSMAVGAYSYLQCCAGKTGSVVGWYRDGIIASRSPEAVFSVTMPLRMGPTNDFLATLSDALDVAADYFYSRVTEDSLDIYRRPVLSDADIMLRLQGSDGWGSVELDEKDERGPGHVYGRESDRRKIIPRRDAMLALFRDVEKCVVGGVPGDGTNYYVSHGEYDKGSGRLDYRDEVTERPAVAFSSSAYDNIMSDSHIEGGAGGDFDRVTVSGTYTYHNEWSGATSHDVQTLTFTYGDMACPTVHIPGHDNETDAKLVDLTEAQQEQGQGQGQGQEQDEAAELWSEEPCEHASGVGSKD